MSMGHNMGANDVGNMEDMDEDMRLALELSK